MDWFSKNKYWIAAFGFFILSTTLRFLAADQTPHPAGWDGYYYVMQVHSWLTYGYLQAPDFSLIYPYLAGIAFITDDFILAYKVGVALLSGLLTVAVFYSLSKKEVAFPWICIVCSYLVFSPLVTYFILQFPKNALGLIFLVLFIASLPNRIMAVGFLLATIVTHRMTGGFALIAAVIYGVKYVPWKWLVVGAILFITISFLPGVLHISDLSRFDGQFTPMPHWAPWAFTGIFPTSLNWLFKADLVLITIMTLACIPLLIVNRRDLSIEKWIWLSVAFISLFPFFKFMPGDAGHRFFMIAPVALSVLVASLMKSQATTRTITMIPVAAVVGLFVILSAFSYRSYRPWAFDAPNNVYLTIVERLTQRFDARNYPLVVAHKSLAEIIIFKTDFDALNWLPPEDMPPDHVLRLTNKVLYSDFTHYLGEDDCRQVRTIARGYFAVPEDIWQKFVTGAKKDNKPKVMNRIFSGTNPMDQRPYFINKGRSR